MKKVLKAFFEENGFKVHDINHEGVEVETWTDGGVNMLIMLEPFTVEEFQDYVNGFDVDEQIENHRGDPSYRAAFTIRQSLDDFTKYEEKLKTMSSKLDEMFEEKYFYLEDGDKVDAKDITLRINSDRFEVADDSDAVFTVWDKENEQHIEVEYDSEGTMYYSHYKKLDLK